MANRREALFGLGLLLSSNAFACSSSEPKKQLQVGFTAENLVVVDIEARRQVIDGFGASSAWNAQSFNDIEADLLFSRELGLGLSLLRLRIAPTGTTWEQGAALKAHQRGAKIWAAPWSPPGEWKTNGSDLNGGSLLPEHYQDWAERLALFAKNKQLEGVPLLGISAQNEPDWIADWETCEWTPQQLVTFIKDHLGPTLREQAPGTALIAPEAANWDSLASYADAILDDAAAASEVGIVAVHSYGGAPYAYEAPLAADKKFWQTEMSYDAAGTGVAAAVYTAAQIHDHLTIANLNAFHYWWLKSETTGALMVDGVVTAQGYGFGHFSKFVRPGYVRVATEPSMTLSDVLLSAYWGAGESTLAIVAINQGSTEATRSIQLDGLTPISATPWHTTSSATLRRQPRLPVTNPLNVTLPGNSITTLVIVGQDDSTGAGGAPGSAGGGGAAGSASGEAGALGDNSSSTGSGGSSPSRNTSSNGGASGSDSNASATTESDGEVMDEAPRKGPYATCLCSAPGQPSGSAPWALALTAWFLVRWRRLRPR